MVDAASRSGAYLIDCHETERLHRDYTWRTLQHRLEVQRGPRKLEISLRLRIVRCRREVDICKCAKAEYHEQEREVVGRATRPAGALAV